MKFKKLFLLLGGAMALVSCATVKPNSNVESEEVIEKDDVTQVSPTRKDLIISPTDNEVTKYIKQQQFDPNQVLAFDLSTKVTPASSMVDKEDGDQLIVTRKEVKDAKSGTASLHALQAGSLLYPGALLRADKGLVEGNPTELANLGRGQTTYEIVNLPGLKAKQREFTVDVTRRSRVQAEIDDAIDTWKGLNKRLTANSTFRITQAFDSDQLSVELGFGIGEKLGIKSDYTQSNEKNIFIVSYEQIFYTINALRYNDTVIFDNTVTKDQLEEECPDSTPPVFVHQANYGMMVYFKIETTKSKSEVNAAFKYAGKIDINSKNEFKKALDGADVTCLVYGGADGSDNPVASPLDKGQETDQINETILASSLPSIEHVGNAVMLSYATSWLKNNSLAKIQSTTKYVETTSQVLNSQKVTLHQRGAYSVSEWNIGAYRIKEWDKETGKPIFGEYREFYKDTYMAVGANRMITIPANYGRITFHYDILLGTKNVYNGRIMPTKDFIGEADITVGGGCRSAWTEITVDGTKVYDA